MADKGQHDVPQWAPTTLLGPTIPEMRHCLTLNLPLTTPLAAQQLYRVLSVDKELKPTEACLRYCIDPTATSVLLIRVHARTVRQLRLTANALMDNVQLILRTMDAFTPKAQRFQGDAKGIPQDAVPTSAPEVEFELNGTGRAG